jgi:putative Mn2+ efflux pump MntP
VIASFCGSERNIGKDNTMQLWELFLTAVALSMDAFAVSVSRGLAAKKVTLRQMLTVGLWFGGFQALMPLLGYFLGSQFHRQIEAVDHWIAFGLLALIGLNMIREAVKGEEAPGEDFGFRAMLPLALATSIDALAVGVTYAFLRVQIVPAVSFIGIVTFFLSALGISAGHFFGKKHQAKAELAGGLILILIGLKILLEHLGIF